MQQQTKTIRFQQFASSIRRPASQRAHLKALKLGKINQISEIIDTPETRGLFHKVAHMVKILGEN